MLNLILNVGIQEKTQAFWVGLSRCWDSTASLKIFTSPPAALNGDESNGDERVNQHPGAAYNLVLMTLCVNCDRHNKNEFNVCDMCIRFCFKPLGIWCDDHGPHKGTCEPCESERQWINDITDLIEGRVLLCATNVKRG